MRDVRANFLKAVTKVARRKYHLLALALKLLWLWKIEFRPIEVSMMGAYHPESVASRHRALEEPRGRNLPQIARSTDSSASGKARTEKASFRVHRTTVSTPLATFRR